MITLVADNQNIVSVFDSLYQSVLLHNRVEVQFSPLDSYIISHPVYTHRDIDAFILKDPNPVGHTISEQIDDILYKQYPKIG